ncbi:rhomboid protease ROM6, putative [Plasmodium knowlesi strain H]|uniref:Rhomboid protease ROM6, putative n=3 Tax=Plasmodium knowlesi TaxID=5850 RepID=A0A5K1V0Z0_PLAKH|nr:rhomboid protease ROM6, putative [Plasmodium knowlesi strain H]OTN66346.1 putative Rhomboid protease ROM6 [Plasmodium knowlesi]CAA9989886.1 rhomboid protease ROM6, putative [Plasmodium knowlesi strain H]SBO24447.1 rhomboid protease ROM6, putative [Plasmodium knowlesi strain H]SBO26555.1 rhomboid protease ROM6, putative [Plasmodium knowlesi strain H]VVS79360.1 rhomboid protease ROM6, putative [Plasmodium knowlesi strain H]|eukprot:XP_002259902.1 serine protease, putative [Plasmodium knowlesi strain H]
MFNAGRYFRAGYHKKKIFHVKGSRQFYGFAKCRKVQTNAIKRKDRIKRGKFLQFKEKLQLIIFSSVYFFACDYVYHVYLLRSNDSRPANHASNNTGEDVRNDAKCKDQHSGGKGGVGTTMMEYIKWMNIFSSAQGKDNQELKQQDNECTRKNDGHKMKNQKDSHKKDHLLNNRGDIKICSVCEEDPYEIKINRFKRSSGKEESSQTGKGEKYGESFYFGNQRDQPPSHDRSSSGRSPPNNSIPQRSSIGGEEKNMKNLFVSNVYRNDLFNGCNLFLFANGVVFLCWRLSEIAGNKKFFHFMCRNFICSYENIRRKYYHTFFTAAISHITLPHFLFNMWAFHTISNTLLSPEIKENKTNYYFFFNYKSSVLEKKMTDKDIMKIYALSSIVSTVPYILLHRSNQLLGASGAVMGLVYILSTVKPNEIFVSLFPLPYLKMTSLQLCHLSILTNFIFLFYRRNHFNVAWLAHLFGLMGGALYNVYQRRINSNKNYYPFIELSVKNGSIDYLNSYLDFVDFLKCLQLQIRIFFSLDPRAIQSMNRKIVSIKNMQSQRRIKYHKLKVKNLEAMSK